MALHHFIDPLDIPLEYGQLKVCYQLAYRSVCGCGNNLPCSKFGIFAVYLPKRLLGRHI